MSNLNIVIIKFGDLFLKGKNRSHFINQLNRGIRNKLSKKHIILVKHDMIEIETNNYKECLDVSSKIFGISKIEIGFKTKLHLDDVVNKLVPFAKTCKGTFKIDCKRQDKKFPIKSDQTKLTVAKAILENTTLKVDVKNPDNIFKILITSKQIYVLVKSFKGLGGLPAKTSGKVLVLLSGGIDSPVAGYLLASRGVHVDFLHFETPPHTSPEALMKVKDLLEKFRDTQKDAQLYVSNFTNIQNEIACACNEAYWITIMRRYFLRVACAFAIKKGYLAIATGEALGQVASQTLESINVINHVAVIPVLRPLLTYDKNNIIEIAKQIDTYNISIRPFDDCCTTFVPKKPVIKPSLAKVIQEEKKIMAFGIIESSVEDVKKVQ